MHFEEVTPDQTEVHQSEVHQSEVHQSEAHQSEVHQSEVHQCGADVSCAARRAAMPDAAFRFNLYKCDLLL